MGDVIKFGSEPPIEQCWQCGHCGCQHFMMLASFDMQCGFCKRISPAGEWRNAVTEWDKELPFHETARTIGDNGSNDIDFNKARVLRSANHETAVIALIQSDGRVTVWDDMQHPTGERLKWLDKMLKSVRELITGQVERIR